MMPTEPPDPLRDFQSPPVSRGGKAIYTRESFLTCSECHMSVHVGTAGPANLPQHQRSKECKRLHALIEQNSPSGLNSSSVWMAPQLGPGAKRPRIFSTLSTSSPPLKRSKSGSSTPSFPFSPLSDQQSETASSEIPEDSGASLTDAAEDTHASSSSSGSVDSIEAPGNYVNYSSDLELLPGTNLDQKATTSSARRPGLSLKISDSNSIGKGRDGASRDLETPLPDSQTPQDDNLPYWMGTYGVVYQSYLIIKRDNASTVNPESIQSCTGFIGSAGRQR
ncbi:hypothetical protein C8R47DRAFT_1148377 [Mycena vitilis]|nr:hypothetical protein C8R47DRAFT_1148377 [Mycena vitilis]